MKKAAENNTWQIISLGIGVLVVILLLLNLFTTEQVKRKNYIYYLRMKPQIVKEIAPTPTHCNRPNYMDRYNKINRSDCKPEYEKDWFQIFGQKLFLVREEIKVKSESTINVESDQKVDFDDVNQVVNVVGKLITLPTGETPSLATVSDVSKLQDQIFFKNAQDGDRVLIYTEAKKAILYRPSTNKVIDVAPVGEGI